MAKFIIRESCIKSDINERYLTLVQNELRNCVGNLQFTAVTRQGNFAIWESSEFSDADYNYGMFEDKVKTFIDNTLNFRYENFTVALTK